LYLKSAQSKIALFTTAVSNYKGNLSTLTHTHTHTNTQEGKNSTIAKICNGEFWYHWK